MDGFYRLGIEYLPPSTRVFQFDWNFKVEQASPSSAQLSKVLFNLGPFVSARGVYLKVLDLPDNRSIVKHDQKVT